MKKIGIIILLVFSFLSLTNCNKDKKEEKKNERISFSDKSYKLFEKFANNKKLNTKSIMIPIFFIYSPLKPLSSFFEINVLIFSSL